MRSEARAALWVNPSADVIGAINAELVARNSVTARAQAAQHCVCCIGFIGQSSSLRASGCAFVMAQQSGFDGGGICARSGKVMATIEAQSRSAPREREIRRVTTSIIRLIAIRRKSLT